MSLIKFHLDDTPKYRELLRKMGAGDNEAIEFFKQHISSAVIECVDAVLARKNTGFKDFFGKDIYIGDEVAMLEKKGSSSVYIRKATVVDVTKQKVKVRYNPQGLPKDFIEETTKEPHNLIKA